MQQPEQDNQNDQTISTPEHSDDMSEELLTLKEENHHLRELVEELKVQAVTDSLTGVYNRAGLELTLNEKINELLRANYVESPAFSLLCVDIDNCKYINDNYGHLAGDQALRQISDILSGRLRNTDIIGRFGGDEFVIGLHDTDKESAYDVASELLQLIRDNPLSVDGDSIELSASIGISSYCYQKDWKELFDEADRSMNEIKQAQKGAIAVYGN